MRILPVAALALVLAAPAALAQPVDAEARAREHYDRGIVHYNLAEYDLAIAQFEKAYELSRAPGLLFNIGQAQRLKGEKQKAVASYRAYLRLDPYASNRAEVEGRIAELERALAAERKVATPPAPPAAPPAKPTATPPAGREQVMRVDANVMRVEVKGREGNRVMMHAGWITAAAGVAVLGTGVYFAVKATQNWDRVENVDQDFGAWGDEEQGWWDDAQSQERTAKVLIGVGSAALVTGGILYVFGARAGGGSVFSAAPRPGGGVVAARFTF